uniref:Uncharacterized protein n=3 Tax=Lotharella globosa TaxID=91324 RepID=A0A7S3Y735_9EUKA
MSTNVELGSSVRGRCPAMDSPTSTTAELGSCSIRRRRMAAAMDLAENKNAQISSRSPTPSKCSNPLSCRSEASWRSVRPRFFFFGLLSLSAVGLLAAGRTAGKPLTHSSFIEGWNTADLNLGGSVNNTGF